MEGRWVIVDFYQWVNTGPTEKCHQAHTQTAEFECYGRQKYHVHVTARRNIREQVFLVKTRLSLWSFPLLFQSSRQGKEHRQANHSSHSSLRLCHYNMSKHWKTLQSNLRINLPMHDRWCELMLLASISSSPHQCVLHKNRWVRMLGQSQSKCWYGPEQCCSKEHQSDECALFLDRYQIFCLLSGFLNRRPDVRPSYLQELRKSQCLWRKELNPSVDVLRQG